MAADTLIKLETFLHLTLDRSKAKFLSSIIMTTEYLDIANLFNIDHHRDGLVHEPLAPISIVRKTIRVVQIQPGSNEAKFECKLRHVAMRDNAHVCVSYMWGEPSPQHAITINEKFFEVGTRLLDVLRQVRQHNISSWLWIDALCINQDDEQEKNHQVRMMGKIYSMAEHVLLFPGINSMEQHKASCKNNRGLLHVWFAQQPETSCEKDRGPWIDPVRDISETLLNLDRQKDDHVESFWYQWKESQGRVRAPPSVTTSEYWRRAWIVQEVLLAKTAFVVSEQHIHDMQLLQKESSISLQKDTQPFANLLSYAKIPKDKKRKDFWRLLGHLGGGLTSVEHDGIYALLGLTNIPPDFGINYGTFMEAVMLDTVEHFGLCHQRTSLKRWKERICPVLDRLGYRLAVRCTSCKSPSWKPFADVPVHMGGFEDTFWTVIRSADGEYHGLSNSDIHRCNGCDRKLTISSESDVEFVVFRFDDNWLMVTMSSSGSSGMALVRYEHYHVRYVALGGDMEVGGNRVIKPERTWATTGRPPITIVSREIASR